MSLFKIAIMVVFWLGQVKLGITIINKYIVFLRDSLAKHLFTIFFGFLMFSWPVFFFCSCRDSLFLQNLLLFRPDRPAGWLLLLFFLYGVFQFFRANIAAAFRMARHSLPERVKLLETHKLHPDESQSWKSPRFPLFLTRPVNLLNDYYTLESTVFEIQCSGLPEAFEGVRIAQLSDLHFDGRLDRRFYEFCVEEINRLRPDLVFVTGDHISRRRYTPEVAGILSGLKPRGTVYVLRGNHDFWEDGPRLRKMFEENGFTLLDNRAVTLERRGQKIRIVGVEHPWKKWKTWDQELLYGDGLFTICATHTPDNFDRAASAGVPLTICGHTHGGQVRVPFFGSIVCPSRFSRRYDQGFFQKADSLLYVNRGVGSTVPFRLRCPSEITLFVLRRIN